MKFIMYTIYVSGRETTRIVHGHKRVDELLDATPPTAVVRGSSPIPERKRPNRARRPYRNPKYS